MDPQRRIGKFDEEFDGLLIVGLPQMFHLPFWGFSLAIGPHQARLHFGQRSLEALFY